MLVLQEEVIVARALGADLRQFIDAGINALVVQRCSVDRSIVFTPCSTQLK
jgi:hypothetical protein